jgi:hypothetical protein
MPRKFAGAFFTLKDRALENPKSQAPNPKQIQNQKFKITSTIDNRQSTIEYDIAHSPDLNFG